MQSSGHEFLTTSVVFLAAAVIAVPIFKRFGLASVLGYLVAGSLLGPFGLAMTKDPKDLMDVAEIGVVMLLFLIGLELKPSRLWTLRHHVFGAGGVQVMATGVGLAVIAFMFGLNGSAAVIVGLSLALSSTAFALQILGERRQINTQFGRLSFAILLFQDLAAIPMLALVPFLVVSTTHARSEQPVAWMPLVLMAVIVGSLPFLMRPALRLIASTRIRELFTAATLFLVLGLALLMEHAGLSMALGSFVGGILLADSEYRHQLEADIEPFKGLLLGLFFMAIGMGVNYRLLYEVPVVVVGLTICMMAIKMLVIYSIGRRFGLNAEGARTMAVALPQAGEFAFVIFSVGLTGGLLDTRTADILNLMIALSMALTPIATLLNDRLSLRIRKMQEPEYDQIENENHPVIIAGFGRFGQILGRILRTLETGFTALEQDPEQVEVLRRFGNKVYYGDASRMDLLEAAGAKNAKIFAVCIDDMEASLRTVDVVKEHFPHLRILARARNRNHVFQLMDRGVTVIFRETLGSSLEMSLQLLKDLGYPEKRALATIAKFRGHDEDMLLKQHSVYTDEKLLIRTSKEAAQQLTDLFKADKEEPAASSL